MKTLLALLGSCVLSGVLAIVCLWIGWRVLGLVLRAAAEDEE